MDYEIPRSTRQCAVSGRQFAPGEEFFSVLWARGAELVRQDFSAEHWSGPPEGAVGWWKSRMPSPESKRIRWAPNDVMLQFFEELQLQPEKQDMCYVLALLLVRRRVLRMEATESDEQGREVLVLHCPRRDATYRVVSHPPDEARVGQIQEELARLFFARAN